MSLSSMVAVGVARDRQSCGSPPIRQLTTPPQPSGMLLVMRRSGLTTTVMSAMGATAMSSGASAPSLQPMTRAPRSTRARMPYLRAEAYDIPGREVNRNLLGADCVAVDDRDHRRVDGEGRLGPVGEQLGDGDARGVAVGDHHVLADAGAQRVGAHHALVIGR